MFSHILKQPLSIVNSSSFGIIWVPKFKKTHMGPNPMYVIINFQIRHTISNYLIFIAIRIILPHLRETWPVSLASAAVEVTWLQFLLWNCHLYLNIASCAVFFSFKLRPFLWCWIFLLFQILMALIMRHHSIKLLAWCAAMIVSSLHLDLLLILPLNSLKERISVFQLWYVEYLQIHDLFSCKFPPIWTVNQLCSINNPLICPLMAVPYIGM